MTKYPLIEAMGLKVRRILEDNSAVYRDVYIIEADELEAALEKAPVVFATVGKSGPHKTVWSSFQNETEAESDTHTARLICIEPIQKDTAESIVADIAALTYPGASYTLSSFTEIATRARKLLE